MKEDSCGDNPNFFRFRIILLRIIGCWSPPEGNCLYGIAACTVLLNSFVGVAFSFSTLILYISEQESIENICSQAIAFIIAFQVFSKSGLTFLKSRQLQQLVNDLNVNLYYNFARKPEDRQIIRKCYNSDVKLSIFLCVFSSFVTAANILKPLIVTLSERKRHFNDTDIVYGEFPSKYPFQVPINSFWYGFWFGQQVLVVLPGGIASWISDSMFCAFLFYICGHFDILVRNVREGGRDLDLKGIVQYHRQIIKFTEETVAAFGLFMVIQLLLAAITICCLLFQFISVGRSPEVSGELMQYSRPLTYLTLKLIQVYIMCWLAQLVLDKSIELGEALYCSPWYGKTRINTTHLKILMIRTRVPLKVSYGAIFHLSAGTFAQILNTAYGYFAMMSKMKQS